MTHAAAILPARAKAPVPALAPPVTAHELEGGNADIGAAVSLARIPLFAPAPPAPPPVSFSPAGPSVQRICETCEAEEKEEGTKVRARLDVGAADDPFEHEADAIAHSVMTMPESDLFGPGQDATGAAPLVQRTCAACSATRDEQLSARRIDEEDLAPGTVRRRTEGLSADADESEAPRMRGEADSDVAPGLAATSSELTTGGMPLSAPARQFFEPRMGRDLSHVRVHSGHASTGLSHSIGARAFTYRNHIWLGRSERHEISFTLAHELAHVLQQTAPGPVGPGAGVRVQADQSGEKLRRTYFYEEDGKALPTTHDEVVNYLTRQDTSIFAEIPVPNASARGLTETKKRFGRSDLVKITGTAAKVPMGMSVVPCPTAQQGYWYCASVGGKPKKPAVLDQATIRGVRQDIIHNGTVWTGHDTQSIPRYGPVAGSTPRNGFIRDAGGLERSAKATVTDPSKVDPTALSSKFEVGDVKAGAFEGAGLKAPRQVTNYLDGFKGAGELYEGIRQRVKDRRAELEAEGKNDFSSLPPALTPWNVSTGVLGEIDKVNAINRIESNKTLKLKRFVGGASMDVPESTTVQGDLYLWKDVGRKEGAWSYIWVPDVHPGKSVFDRIKPDDKLEEHSRDAACLRDALSLPIESSGKPSSIAKARLAPECLQPLHVTPARPLVRRNPTSKKKAAPQRVDPFKSNYDKWLNKRAKLERGFGEYQRTSVGRKRAAALGELEARRGIVDVLPDVVGAPKRDKILDQKANTLFEANQREMVWLETLSSQSGRLIGALRYRFGALFLSLVAAYQRTKEKITEFLEGMKPKQQTRGLGGAAMKILAKILGAIGNKIMPKVMNALADCLEKGFTAKLDEMFADGPISDMRAQIGKVEAFANTLTDEAIKKVTAVGDTLIKEWKGTFEKIKEDALFIKKMVEIAKGVIDAVRLAICVVGGVESFGLACAVSLIDKVLSLFGASPLEKLAESLLSTCMGQTQLTQALMAFDTVKQLPTTIAATIVGIVKPELPEQAQDLLCDPKTMQVEMPPVADVTCGKGGSPAATPGPDADGSYTKGTWKPPAGFLTEEVRKIMEDLEKESPNPDLDPTIETWPPKASEKPKKKKKNKTSSKKQKGGKAEAGPQPANQEPRIFWMIETPIDKTKRFSGTEMVVTLSIRELSADGLSAIRRSDSVEATVKLTSIQDFKSNEVIHFEFTSFTGFIIDPDDLSMELHTIAFGSGKKWNGATKLEFALKAEMEE